MNWQCRWSPTLGRLEDTHEKVWGTKPYTNDSDSTVFFGCYGLPDFYTIWRHKGPKHILWAGTDITHLQNHYWLEDGGGIRIDNEGICTWLNKHCTNWCENEVEQRALADLGIESTVRPSFLGDIDEFPVSFKPGNKVYASVSGNNFEQYGWDKIVKLAQDNGGIEVVLYGNTIEPPYDYPPNVTLRGRVPKEQMNAEIKDMQGGLRMTEFDGASEIIVKAILMGQYAFSLIKYPFVDDPRDISLLLSRKSANIEGRNWWRNNLNLYPWNTSAQKKQEEG